MEGGSSTARSWSGTKNTKRYRCISRVVNSTKYVGVLLAESTFQLHPPKQTWNLKMDSWKRRFLLETIISRFHVEFGGCTVLTGMILFSQCHPSAHGRPLETSERTPPSLLAPWAVRVHGHLGRESPSIATKFRTGEMAGALLRDYITSPNLNGWNPKNRDLVGRCGISIFSSLDDFFRFHVQCQGILWSPSMFPLTIGHLFPSPWKETSGYSKSHSIPGTGIFIYLHLRNNQMYPKNHGISKVVVWRSQTPAIHIQTPL